MHNPELLALSRVPWQFFCTFTFKTEKDCSQYGVTRFFSLMRWLAKVRGIHFSELKWCLRRERGENTGRAHFHAIIAGLGPSVDKRDCFVIMSMWEKLRGGIARVSIYNPTLDGLDYILKGSEAAVSLSHRRAGDYHELSKFGGSCELTLSMSVIRFLENRLRFGHRSVPQDEGDKQSSSTLQSPVKHHPVLAVTPRR